MIKRDRAGSYIQEIEAKSTRLLGILQPSDIYEPLQYDHQHDLDTKGQVQS